MLTLICQYLRNYFVRDKVCGKFTVADGEISARGLRLSDFLQDEQYFRIVGSVFNDGVHQFGVDALRDEREFSGTIYAMAVPPEVVSLADEIEQWCKDNAAAINSPYQSESFGGYSYSKGNYGTGSGDGSVAISWQSQFAPRLSAWRKISL